MFDAMAPCIPNKGSLDIIIGTPAGFCPARLKSENPTTEDWYDWCRRVVATGFTTRPKRFFTAKALIYWLKFDIFKKTGGEDDPRYNFAVESIRSFFSETPYGNFKNTSTPNETSDTPDAGNYLKNEYEEEEEEAPVRKTTVLPAIDKPRVVPKVPSRLK